MKNKVAKKNNLLLFLILLPPLLQAQLYFNQLDSLFAYADRSSASAKISAQQSLLAKWTKVAAYANSINFKNPVSFSATNNLLLPVNFIPSEAFGGAQGSFREITLGQQYVSNFNFNPQIDIINPQNWAKIKSAELNQEMTELSNNMAKKSLHESIAAAYFNCLALEEQVDTAEKNLSMADSIRLIVKNKFELGIAREQDLNNATVNMLNVQDKVQQLQAVHQQQVNNLKILCDIPSNMMVTLKDEGATNTEQKIKTGATLESKFSLLQSRFQNSEWKATRLSMLPTLSLVYSNSWQH